MWFSFTILLVVVVVSAHNMHFKNIRDDDDNNKELKWPEKYAYEIIQYNLQSGLAEDVKVWKTMDESRIDYNQGAVKYFVTKAKEGKKYGYKYEIHPETHGEDQMNEIVCHSKRRSRFSGPQDILPETEDYEFIGDELMGNKKCDKFYKETTEKRIDSKEKIWAYYNESIEAYVLIRYELEQFNNMLGYMRRHDLWEFENFSDDFDEETTFDTSKECGEKTVRHKKHDEAITKHLLFVDPENKDHVDHVFKAFQNTHNKKYAHDEEHEMRKSIFQENLRFIKSTNRKNLGYKLSVNKFADLTHEEKRRYMGLLRRPEGKKGLTFPYNEENLSLVSQHLPSEYDLRLEGIISPVQNQETCGSCWTFGTTSAMEGAVARSNGGNLIRLSNQALIDCAWEFGAHGCDGGTDNAAYEWMQKYGLPKISDYGTYKDQDGFCHIQNVSNTYSIKAFVDVTPNSIEALKVAVVNHGPLSVSVAATDAFLLYNEGVFYDMTCNNDPDYLNHEITLVGYGEQYGETYWIVKNSWGQDWGIDGYMHIAAKDNNCGIMTEPTYVIL